MMFSINVNRDLVVGWLANPVETGDCAYEDSQSARIVMKGGMDTMVASALKAQLRGHGCVDVTTSIGSSHIGGFSYIRASKVQNVFRKRASMWLRRLRLNRRVRDLFHELGWDPYLDVAYEERLRSMEDFVRSSFKLRALSCFLGPSMDETNFEFIRSELAG